MKNKLSLLLLFSLSILCIHTSKGQCKVSRIVEEGKLEVDPAYLYDGFTLSNFTMDAKPKKQQVQFTALKGQKYKLYFCNSGFAEEVKISVFKHEKDDKLSTDLLGANTVKDQYIEFDLAKSGNYTIEYNIPICENAEYGNTKNECIVLLISYK